MLDACNDLLCCLAWLSYFSSTVILFHIRAIWSPFQHHDHGGAVGISAKEMSNGV